MFSIPAENGALIEVVLANGPRTITRKFTGTGQIAPVVLSDNDLNLLGDGTISVVTKATDAGGNSSRVEGSFVLDRVAPSPSVVTISGEGDGGINARESSNIVPITMTTEPTGRVVSVRVDAIEILRNGGKYSLDTTARPKALTCSP